MVVANMEFTTHGLLPHVRLQICYITIPMIFKAAVSRKKFSQGQNFFYLGKCDDESIP
jgi:hypothetical protein